MSSSLTLYQTETWYRESIFLPISIPEYNVERQRITSGRVMEASEPFVRLPTSVEQAADRQFATVRLPEDTPNLFRLGIVRSPTIVEQRGQIRSLTSLESNIEIQASKMKYSNRANNDRH